jgi:hypothetical protein
MYNFHYGYVKPEYGDRATLLRTDTDSLCYSVETEDIYEDMRQNMSRFDTSNYDPCHPLFSNANKQVLGKMKDETSGVPIREFVGLKSKMYSFKTPDVEKKIAKGIARGFVKRHLSHEDYKKALLNTTAKRSKGSWTKIGSDNQHELATLRVSKSLLSAYDDKRYVLGDGIKTLAIGHYKMGVNDSSDSSDSSGIVSDEEAEEELVRRKKKEEKNRIQLLKNAEAEAAERRRSELAENRRKRLEDPTEWENHNKAVKRRAERERRAAFTPEKKKREQAAEKERRARLTDEQKAKLRKKKTEAQRARRARQAQK